VDVDASSRTTLVASVRSDGDVAMHDGGSRDDVSRAVALSRPFYVKVKSLVGGPSICLLINGRT
jgi:hypothetical protein